MGLHPGLHLIDGAPHHDRVDEPVGAAVGAVVLAEAEPKQVVPVVGEAEVDLHALAGNLPRSQRISLEHAHLLRGEQRVGPHHLARNSGVLGCLEVRVRSVGLRCCQRQHLRTERGEHPRWPLGRADGEEAGRIHAVEVDIHVGERLRIVVLAHTGDEVRMADAEAEQEPPGKCVLDGAHRRVHRHRVTRVDVGDARRQLQCRGVGEVVRGRDERIAPDRLRNPHRRNAHRLDGLHRFDRCARRHAVERPRPDSNTAQIDRRHGRVATTSRALRTIR